jgi:hypothetical protein
MIALLLAALLAATPQTGTVYTADGGRIRGTVLEAGPGGVSVQLADGSTRKIDPAQVSRVDFADGTSWKPAAPAPAASAAAPAAVAVAAAPAAAAKPAPMAFPVEKLDLLHLANGGRVRAFVVEAGPEGVVVRLTDGNERRYAPGQVTRIDWADGSRYDLAAPQAAAAPAAR